MANQPDFASSPEFIVRRVKRSYLCRWNLTSLTGVVQENAVKWHPLGTNGSSSQTRGKTTPVFFCVVLAVQFGLATTDFPSDTYARSRHKMAFQTVRVAFSLSR